ncbi:hypothetical protein AKJ16_DCAP20448 [Drosera capensis]
MLLIFYLYLFSRAKTPPEQWKSDGGSSKRKDRMRREDDEGGHEEERRRKGEGRRRTLPPITRQKKWRLTEWVPTEEMEEEEANISYEEQLNKNVDRDDEGRTRDDDGDAQDLLAAAGLEDSDVDDDVAKSSLKYTFMGDVPSTAA